MSPQDSRTRILDVALRLFASRGYEGTSLKSIADEVGMRKPSLLYHYPSKEALREAVLGMLVQHWQIRLPEILAATFKGKDQFEALVVELVAFFQEDPHRALMVMREVIDRPREIRERMGQTIAPYLVFIRQSIEEGKAAGRVRPEVDAEAYLVEIIVMVVSAFVATDLAKVIFPDRANQSRQLNEILRLARTGLFTEETLQRSSGLSLTPNPER